MWLTRRNFVVTLAGAPLARPTVSLSALHAAQLPATLDLAASIYHQALQQGAQIFERRKYSAPLDEKLFANHSMNVWRTDDHAYLFAFHSLAARQKAWDLFNVDPTWRLLRDGVRLTEVALYSAIL